MKLYDAHTHLNAEPLVQDRNIYMQKFMDAGGIGLVNSGADEFYNLQGIEIAKKMEGETVVVKATLGWHPLECVENIITSENIVEKMAWLKKLYLDNSSYVVAIGETGIDLHYPNSLATLELQKQLFVLHCELARELNIPIVIHSRDAFEATFELLKKYNDLTIYFHCRGYGPNEFRLLNAEFKKLYIGFCGNITYKKTEELGESLKIISLDQLLLETDAPYLTPQIVRGATNHPANIQYIYEFVSEFLDIEKNVLSDQIEKNFKNVYRIV